MIRYYLSLFMIFTSIAIGIVYLSNVNSFCLYGFYSQKLQMPLFTGFLTIGGFLLSLKTFILVKLKEGLFDNEDYKVRLAERQALNPKISHYGPLARLGSFLIYCVLGSLITAFYQFSFGFIQSNIIAAIGISLAFSTLSVVFLAWWEIRCNLNIWFEILEEGAKKRSSEAERPQNKD